MTSQTLVPSTWATCSLGDICEVEAGSPAPQADTAFSADGVSFVRVQDLGRMGEAIWLDDTRDHLSEKAAGKLRRFPAGTVLFTKSGMSTLLNQRAILKRDMAVVSHIGTVLPPAGVLNTFVLYWLKTVDFGAIAHATTLPSLPLTKVRSIPFPLPPLAEQRRIVEEIEKQFTRLDAAVEALRAAQAKLKRYRASVLNAAVTGRLVPTEAALAAAEGRDYEHASVLLERIARERAEQERGKPRRKRPIPAPVDASTLPELPEGWEWTALSSIGQVRLGRQRSPARATGPNMRPYLRAANVTWNGLDLSDVKQMDFDPNEFDLYQLLPGDILLSEASGTADEVGKPAVYDGEIDECCFQNTLIRVRAYPDIVPYLYYRLFSDASAGAFGRAARGISIHHLGAERTESWIVSLPPLAEQHRIVAEVDRRLSAIQQAEAAVTANLKRAERLRQAVLKRALEGRLVPQDPDDEPAAVLLERVRTEKAAATQQHRRRGRSSWKEQDTAVPCSPQETDGRSREP